MLLKFPPFFFSRSASFLSFPLSVCELFVCRLSWRFFFFFFLPLSPFLLSHLFLLSSVHFPSFIHTHTHTWHTHTLIMSQHAPSPVELFHKMPLTHERGLFERNCCSQPIMHAIMSSGDSDTAPSSPDSDIGSADTAAWAYGYPSNERSTTQPTAPTSQPPQSRNVPPPGSLLLLQPFISPPPPPPPQPASATDRAADDAASSSRIIRGLRRLRPRPRPRPRLSCASDMLPLPLQRTHQQAKPHKHNSSNNNSKQQQQQQQQRDGSTATEFALSSPPSSPPPSTPKRLSASTGAGTSVGAGTVRPRARARARVLPTVARPRASDVAQQHILPRQLAPESREASASTAQAAATPRPLICPRCARTRDAKALSHLRLVGHCEHYACFVQPVSAPNDVKARHRDMKRSTSRLSPTHVPRVLTVPDEEEMAAHDDSSCC